MGKTDLGDGYTRWDWRVHYPINNYDVSLNIGKRQITESRWTSAILAYELLADVKARTLLDKIR